MKVLKGIGVSNGIGIGKATILDRGTIPVPHFKIKQNSIQREISRLKKALQKSKEELQRIKDGIDKKSGRDIIFILDAHTMILEDRTFIKKTIERIKNEKINCEWAIEKTLAQTKEVFSRVDDEYIRERSRDLDHVFERVLKNLYKKNYEKKKNEISGVIITKDLAPADAAQLKKEAVFGIVSDMGTRTSHTAILARALEIPAVVGLGGSTESIKDGDNLIVDGIKGKVLIHPTPEVHKKYLKLQKKFLDEETRIKGLKNLKPLTRDGTYIKLMANIEFLEEIPSVIANGAEGIGLFRTEFLYLNRNELPSEEEHFSVYKEVARKINPMHTIVRTVDIGGDKLADFLNIKKESNPALGMRAIRLCLRNMDLFRIQLRAILRASAYGKLKILIPMIADLNEVIKAKDVISELKEELRTKGIPFDENIPLGIMIETPSASVLSDVLAKEVDFFSIGTNDLIQYSLAIDRSNEHVAYLYDPLHPAILRLIKNIIKAGEASNIEVNICGEMAGDTFLMPILIGLGLRQLSMDPRSIPVAKNVINNIGLKKAEEIASIALEMKNSAEISEILRKELGIRILLKEDFI